MEEGVIISIINTLNCIHISVIAPHTTDNLKGETIYTILTHQSHPHPSYTSAGEFEYMYIQQLNAAIVTVPAVHITLGDTGIIKLNVFGASLYIGMPLHVFKATEAGAGRGVEREGEGV